MRVFVLPYALLFFVLPVLCKDEITVEDDDLDAYAPYVDCWDIVDLDMPLEDELCDSISSSTTLDLADPDETRVHRNGRIVSGVIVITIVPKSDETMTMVAHRGEIIWIADEGERCTFAEMFSGSDGRLAIVRIEDAITLTYKRFEEVDGKWRYSPIDEFYMQLHKMMGMQNDDENWRY